MQWTVKLFFLSERLASPKQANQPITISDQITNKTIKIKKENEKEESYNRLGAGQAQHEVRNLYFSFGLVWGSLCLIRIVFVELELELEPELEVELEP